MISNTAEQFIWAERFRPKTVAECILPQELKKTFQGFVDKKNIPNMLLYGPPGIGKTTVAMAMLEQLDCNYMKIPASLEGNIDTLRTKILNFASTVSFKGGRKYVILDECDYLTHVTQPALRNFIDDYSDNAGFILTANYRNRIIEPLQSRCFPVDFSIDKKDRSALASQFLHRVIDILDQEKIVYNKPAVAALITKFFPDWRRVLNELQRYSVTGTIDSGILTNAKEVSIKELIGFLQDKNFTKVRQWAADHVSNDYANLYREFYDTANSHFKPSYVPQLVLLIAKYMTQSAMVFDQEINFAAFCVELMLEGEWK